MPKLPTLPKLLPAAFLWLIAASPAPADEKPPPAGRVSFLRDVAPVLQESCFACHDARRRNGKYDMTTFEKLMAGGVNGEAILPGDATGSDFHALVVTADDRRMPPRDKGAAVPAAKAKLLAEWIAQGAKPDPGLDPKADLATVLRKRWQPPAPPEAYPFPVAVNALAFTPDGKHLVAGGHHELTVWAVPAGKLVARVRTRAERAYGMTFVAGGLLAVAGGRPGVAGDVRLYDLTAGGPTVDGVRRLDGVNDPKVMVAHLLDADDSVLCLAATPDGRRLAAGGCDRAARVWDVSGGAAGVKLLDAVEGHADWVLGVALSPDGRLLATASRDRTAKTYDLAAHEPAVAFAEHQQPVHAVAFRPDGKTVVSAGADGKLRAWPAAGEVNRKAKPLGGHAGDIFRIAVNPARPQLATASSDGAVRLWDGDKPTDPRKLTGLTDCVYTVAYSPDGRHVAAAGYSGTVALWPTAGDTKPTTTFSVSPGFERR